jgi:hypothetical protein
VPKKRRFVYAVKTRCCTCLAERRGWHWHYFPENAKNIFQKTGNFRFFMVRLIGKDRFSTLYVFVGRGTREKGGDLLLRCLFGGTKGWLGFEVQAI